MNKTIIAAVAAGIIVLGLIFAPLSFDQFADAGKVKMIVQTKSFTSMQDPGQGHETHQIAIILPPMEDVVYTGRFSYTASAPVQVAILHDIKEGTTPTKIYTIDGEKKWDLTLIEAGNSNSMSFAGAALALHTKDGTEFTATVTVHARATAMKGELPSMTPPKTEEEPKPVPTPTGEMARTITVSEYAPWFQPAALQVDPGTPIVWDAGHTTSIHTVTFVTRVTDLQLNMDKEFTAKTFTLLSPGDRSAVWKPEAGVYVYVCAVHPYMTGVVSAGVPYNAITGEIGGGEGDPTVATFAPWYPSAAPWQDFRPFKDVPMKPGVGEVWVDTQFEVMPNPDSPTGKFGKQWPGTITIVDAENWEVTGKIGEGLNNPHNLMASPDGKYMIQTNWHDDYLTLIDAMEKKIVKNYIQTGPDPAHVAWTEDNKYIITGVNAGAEMQFFDAEQVTDPDVPATDIKPVATIKASVPLAGPHGFWYRDGLLSIPYHLANHMVVASVEEKKELFTPININEMSDDITEDLDDKIGAGIDLASYLGPEKNGHRFWVTTEVLLEHSKLLQGRLLIFDIGSAVGGPTNPTFVTMLELGSIPIQSPVSPDGRYVVTANAGGIGVKPVITVTELDYNNPANSRVVAKIDGYPGSHGVEYGYKKDGGLYAYVSNKFAPVLQVVDLTTSPPSLAGEIDLGNGWGGMGVMTMPDAVYYPTLDEHPLGKLYK
jgi:plastocyanin/DNA-binding beta-propeller fold protein YncE